MIECDRGDNFDMRLLLHLTYCTPPSFSPSSLLFSTRHGFAVPGLPSTGGLPHLSPVEVALRMQRLPELQTPDEFQEWRKWMDAFVGVNG